MLYIKQNWPPHITRVCLRNDALSRPFQRFTDVSRPQRQASTRVSTLEVPCGKCGLSSSQPPPDKGCHSQRQQDPVAWLWHHAAATGNCDVGSHSGDVRSQVQVGIE